MNSLLARFALALGLATGLAGCYVYDPYYPYPQVSPQQAFDRYWNAAMYAFYDQGVEITGQNRAAGVLDGRRGGITVQAKIIPQADGRFRVEFNHAGAMNEDPSLPDRISRAYDARLGR